MNEQPQPISEFKSRSGLKRIFVSDPTWASASWMPYSPLPRHSVMNGNSTKPMSRVSMRLTDTANPCSQARRYDETQPSTAYTAAADASRVSSA